MKKNTLIAVSIICTIAGFFVFALQQGWIIIRSPKAIITESYASQATTASKKKVTLFFWHQDKWNYESTQLLWSDNQASNAHLLINSWLTLLDEDKIMHKKVSLQSALIAQSGNDVYLSFDQYPFNEQATTHEKWLWIEGILKTLRENGVQIPLIHFMVNHQPLQDMHLDFSNAWPLQGFIQS